jgi:hypothetical protein
VLIVKLWAKAEATKTRGKKAAFIVQERGGEQRGMGDGKKGGLNNARVFIFLFTRTNKRYSVTCNTVARPQ